MSNQHMAAIKRSWVGALILSIFGWLEADRFYLG